MSTVTTQEMLDGVQTHLGALERETFALEKMQRGIGADTARMEQELGAAWAELSEVILPALTPAALDGAARLLRSPAFASAEVQRRMNETFGNNTNRAAKLRAEPNYANREALLNANQIRYAEVKDAAAAIAESLAPLEAMPYFQELLSYRYGTPEYSVKFWQMSYYAHWKHADLIVEAHGPRLNATDFATIARKYIDEKSAFRQLEATKQVLDDEKKAIDTLVAQVAQLEAQNAALPTTTLTSLRGRVRSQLEPLSERELAQLLAPLPAALQVWKRIVGLSKKREYLLALNQQQVMLPLSDLRNMEAKLRQERMKLMRPKNAGRRFPRDQYERRFSRERILKLQKRRERIDAARTHIVEYHHYDRWDPYGDVLWWDLMSDGELDGNFIDEVRARPVHHHHSVHNTFVDRDVDHSFSDVS